MWWTTLGTTSFSLHLGDGFMTCEFSEFYNIQSILFMLFSCKDTKSTTKSFLQKKCFWNFSLHLQINSKLDVIDIEMNFCNFVSNISCKEFNNTMDILII